MSAGPRMGRGFLETCMGIIVLMVAVGFAYQLYQAQGRVPADSYRLEAEFMDSGGLTPGVSVVIGGIAVGQVVDVRLEDYFSIVGMALDLRYPLPEDTTARITSYGMLSKAVLELSVGKSQSMLLPGGRLTQTQDAVSIEQSLGDVIFGLGGD